MSSNENTQHVKIVTADPSALGLFGLAVVTLVASSQKLGWTDGTMLVLPWAIFLGSFAQLIACFQDFKHNNTFGATAFGAYGLFWLGIALTWINKMFLPDALVDLNQLGFAYIAYLIFTLYMTVIALETNKVLFVIFFLIDLLFIGLIGDTFKWGHCWHSLAAWSELAIAIVSFYGSAGCVAKGHLGFALLPLGKPFGILKKKD